MKFKGEPLSVGQLISASNDASGTQPLRKWPTEFDAARAARACSARIRAFGSRAECWRFGILQTIDYYQSAVARGGVSAGSRVFRVEPAPTGDEMVDACFAALAEYLADRDGWSAPQWTLTRYPTGEWVVPEWEEFRTEAVEQSPPPFKSRNIYVTPLDLTRA